MGKVIGIIPCRIGSSRFPGKPLAVMPNGQTMVRTMVEIATSCRSLDTVVVTAPDIAIAKNVSDLPVTTVITSHECRSGTERCCQAANELGLNEDDLIVNIQGDEPMLQHWMLDCLVEVMQDHQGVELIGTMGQTIWHTNEDPNEVKVKIDNLGRAVWFRRKVPSQCFSAYVFRHIGVYAYRYSILKKVASDSGDYDLEQLGFMKMGFPIQVITIPGFPKLVSVNAPEDILKLM